MGTNKEWYKKWRFDCRTREFEHVGGLALKLEPETTPLAWRFVLLKPLPAGYVLSVNPLYRTTHEALRLLQADCFHGRFLSGAILPAKGGSLLAKDFPPLPDGPPTQQQIDALLDQWKKARAELQLRP